MAVHRRRSHRGATVAYVVSATWTAEPGQEAIVLDAIEKLTPPSREEPGNSFYQAYQDPGAPNVFHLFEIYDDEDAYAAHGASPHFKEFALEQAIPVLAKRERAFFQTIG
jgi:quinol monooxygenase YgiN